MEKRRPHYDLGRIQALVADDDTRLITTTAFETAVALGLSTKDMIACIRQLCSADFYKSMTAHFDRTLWQDVYRPTYAGGRLYVKVQVNRQDQAVIISFKELAEND